MAHRTVRLTRRISIISRYYLPYILSWGLVQERGDLLPVPISPLATIQDKTVKEEVENAVVELEAQLELLSSAGDDLPAPPSNNLWFKITSTVFPIVIKY